LLHAGARDTEYTRIAIFLSRVYSLSLSFYLYILIVYLYILLLRAGAHNTEYTCYHYLSNSSLCEILRKDTSLSISSIQEILAIAIFLSLYTQNLCIAYSFYYLHSDTEYTRYRSPSNSSLHEIQSILAIALFLTQVYLRYFAFYLKNM